MAFPRLHPDECMAMEHDSAAALLGGRISLMRLASATAEAEAASPPEREGVRWDEARPGPGGTTIVPVHGIEGLKALARMGSQQRGGE